MAEAAEKIDLELPAIRRYQTADIMKHADWLFPRMEKYFPHMTRAAHYTWLLNMLQNHDVLPLFHETGIALAVATKPMIGNDEKIEELFVWVKDAADPEQMAAGGHFYNKFYEWAAQRGAQIVLVENNTDISRKAITEATGRRVFDAKLAFMRVRE